MGNTASRSRWVINSTSQGNKRLTKVESSQVSTDRSRQVVTAQGEDVPVGTIKIPGGITIKLSVYEEEGIPEVDYRYLDATDEWFSMDREIVAGKAYQYLRCQVSKVEPSGDNQGKAMLDVEIVCHEEKPL